MLRRFSQNRWLYNVAEGRPRALVRLVVQTGLYYTVNLLLYALLGFLFFAVLPTAEGLNDGQIMQTPSFMLTATIVTGLGVLGSVWLAGRFLDHRPFADFGMGFDRAWWGDLVVGMGLGALLMAGIFAVQLRAGWLTITQSMAGRDLASVMAGLLAPLILYVAVGVYEEVLFRGYRMRNLAEGLNLSQVDPRWALVGAWLLSSIWFGLAHRNNPNASLISNINLALAGLMLGLAYLFTGRLGLSIGLHITWNFFQGSIFGFPVSGTRIFPDSLIQIEQGGPDLWTGGSFGPEAGLLGIFAMAIGCLLILAWVRIQQGQVAPHLPLTVYRPRHPQTERADSTSTTDLNTES